MIIVVVFGFEKMFSKLSVNIRGRIFVLFDKSVHREEMDSTTPQFRENMS